MPLKQGSVSRSKVALASRSTAEPVSPLPAPEDERVAVPPGIGLELAGSTTAKRPRTFGGLVTPQIMLADRPGEEVMSVRTPPAISISRTRSGFTKETPVTLKQTVMLPEKTALLEMSKKLVGPAPGT